MKVSAVSELQRQMPLVSAGKGIGRPAHAGPRQEGPQGVASGQNAVSSNEQEAVSGPVGENSAGGAKGVLRLLQEGHFRGVADVRLRINFHEELAAIQYGALRDVAPDKLQGISDAVNARVDALIDSGHLTEEQQASVGELRQTFLDTVQQLADEFLGAAGPQSDSLASGLQDAFDAFLESLTALLLPEQPSTPPTDDEPGVKPPADVAPEESPDAVAPPDPKQPPAEPPGEPTPDPFDAEAYLGDLTAAFSATLAQLVEALQTTSALPELSPPNGNGGAYAKFLAMYQELWGLAGDGQTSPEEPLDTVA